MPKLCAIIVVMLAALASASAEMPHAGIIRVASIYISPDANSAKLAEIERGREVVVLETSGEWAHVEANLTEEKTVTGWMLNKGVIQPSTPDGDRILFGEAVDSEDQASERHGRRGAAQDAMRLYYRVYDIFPNSPLAGEALYRSADIRWQIDKEDVMSRSSAKEKEAFMRVGMDEELMRKVMKKFPGTKWAEPGGVSSDRKQAVRRLAGRCQMSRQRSGDVREVCGRAPAVAGYGGGALRRGLAAFGAD